MRVFLCFLLALCSFECTLCGNLPSYLKACSASDPNLNACIEKTIVAAGPKFTYGIPEFGVEPLDPIQLGTIPIDNAGLKLTFKNTVVSGLRGFKLNSFKMNTAKGRVMLDFTANVTLKGDYDMDGQIIILPIKGHGQTKIKITNLNIIIKYEFVTKDGYWVVTDHKDMYKMDRAVFKFTNLFGGNKQLADTTSQFMNQNWSIIMEEIAPPAVKLIIKKCVDEVKKLFANVPAAELMLP